MDIKILQKINDNNLSIVEVTRGNNGFPINTCEAVTGFKSFKDAEELASDVQGVIVELHKSNGWQCWESLGSCFEPFDMMKILSDKANVCTWYRKDSFDDESDFIETCVDPELDSFTNFEELKNYVDIKHRTWQTIQNLKEDEIMYCDPDCGEPEAVKRYVMEYEYDLHFYSIAVMQL